MTRIPASNLRAAKLELGDDEVHIWWADLDKACVDLEAFQLTLSEDERARAERFRLERDRNRFIAARGTLRQILGNYLAIKPHTIQFDYGKNGKPRLAGKFANHIEFNVSHSEGIALYGFFCDQEIGVDVERIIEVPEMEEIAKHYFTNKESEAFFKLPSGEKLHAFFRCWTLKFSSICHLNKRSVVSG